MITNDNGIHQKLRLKRRGNDTIVMQNGIVCCTQGRAVESEMVNFQHPALEHEAGATPLTYKGPNKYYSQSGGNDHRG